MEFALFAAILVLALICLLLAACLLWGRAELAGALGGAASARPRRAPRRPDPARSPHLVVDTLNLVHWMHGEELRAREGAGLTPALITETVARTAPALKLRHPGTVTYVIKDRESQFNSEAARAEYGAAAKKSRVTVAVAEKYLDPPEGVAHSQEHSARGRDDFYMAVLADRYKCAVLTNDRLQDFDRFRATVQPFHVYVYSYWRDRPDRDYIRPEAGAFARLRKPRTVRPSEYFDEPG